MEKTIKLVSAAEAISTVGDGSTIAIAGSLVSRHPMVLVQELIRQNKKNLTLYGRSNGIDFDMLIGCGLVKEAQSSRVGLGTAGPAGNFERALDQHTVRYIKQSEAAAMEKFRAGANGLSFAVMHSDSAYGSGDTIKKTVCPFTGKEYAAAAAFRPDVAIMHAHRADKYGNVQLDPRRLSANETDLLMAWSARKIIVSAEQIVSEESIIDSPNLTVLPQLFVDYVVEAPYGAHPNSCDTRYDLDLEHLRYYQECCSTQEGFDRYIKEYVLDTGDWLGYLDKIGLEHLLSIDRERMGNDL